MCSNSVIFTFLSLQLMLAIPASAAGREPEEIFSDYCFACHGTGWEDAPVLGDPFSWEERIEKGMDALLKNTIDGFNTMPAKGTCGDCTEQELKSVIEFLIAN